MNVVTLPSSRGRDARDNLADFIDKAKASKSFGSVDWAAPVWNDVVTAVTKRASTGRKSQSLNFTLQGGERGTKQQDPIPEPMGDFAKAFVRNRESERSTAIENHRVSIRAFRYLAGAMGEDNVDPCLLMPHHFDEAANRARRDLGPDTAYGTGKALAEISLTLAQFNIGRVRFEWSNSIRRPHTQDRVTDEAVARREAKLPSEAALDALPQIANMVGDDEADTLRMRTVELLVCGGWRINELMEIPAECEVEEIQEDGSIRYGIIYKGEKGFGGSIKWMPTVMIDVAKRAIADIKRITDPVRADAVWMAANPGLVNIPELATDLDRMVPLTELKGLMGWKSTAYNDLLSKYGVQRLGDFVRAGDMVAAMFGQVPATVGRLPLHKHLFLIRENMVHRQRGIVPGSVRMLTSGMINDFLTEKPGRQSLFATYGFTEPDGTPIRMTTHQFRHWLNTIAQEGGLQQELVARWSGRKDMNQNAAYDHVSGKKLAEHVRTLAEKGAMMGPLTTIRDFLPIVDRKTFMETAIASAHVTEIGLCVHDWNLAPCPVHGDCSNCGEHIVDKGNAGQAEEAQRQLSEVEQFLAAAAVEVGEGTYGASRWEQAHRHKRDGLLRVIAVHQDAAVADGTLVHLGSSATGSGDGR